MPFSGCVPPHATYPDEIVPVFLPGPVTADPDDVVALRPFLRRDFVDRGRGFALDDWPFLATEINQFGEGLVNGPAGEDFGLRFRAFPERGRDFLFGRWRSVWRRWDLLRAQWGAHRKDGCQAP
jgi:hypothetical protein